MQGKSRTTIICAATGSGKSTQIPQYIHEFDPTLRIDVTQPRRVAALSVAERVAAECGCVIGEEVGYCVRFAEKTSGRTRIRFCTDGIAVREALQDKKFGFSDVFLVDEAHERSV